MIIKDPHGLLPNGFKIREEIPGMVLEVPDRGISLYPKSIEKLLAKMRTGQQPVAFQPLLPVTSDLELCPPFPTLAYLYSQESNDNQKNWQQFLHSREGEKSSILSLSKPFSIISQTDLDEQLYYFADCYGKAVKPSYIRVVVGNTCNLKCVMCPYHSSLLKATHTTDFFKSHQIMSWEMMSRLARDCGEGQISIVIGNIEEPMLHPNLLDFIRLSRNQGVPAVHLTTNGQLLDEKRAKDLLEAGLTSIDISIDAAYPDTYLKIRGADLNRVETNVLNFLKLRDRLRVPCVVRTSFVRNQDITIEEEQNFKERWLCEVDGVFINNVAKYQETNTRLSGSNQAVQASLQQYLQKARGRWACLFPFTEMAVLPDGRIYYCVETLFRLGFDRELVSLGDYNRQTIQEIWCGEPFNQLRRDLILNRLENRAVCKNCELWMAQVMSRIHQNGLEVASTTITEIYQRKLEIRF